jgi:hypothetical protein
MYSDKTVHRHRFPKYKTTFDAWVKRSVNDKLLNKPIDMIYKSFVMCDKHFDESCKNSGLKKLNINSMPTLNLPGKYIILILFVETYNIFKICFFL